MCAAATTDPKGLKRICPNCGTRYFDMNKRPVQCPSCSTEFKIESKTKGRRGRLPANDPVKVAAPVRPAPEEEDVAAAGEDGDETVSLEEVEEDEEEAADEDIDAIDPDLDIAAEPEVDDELEDDEDDEDDAVEETDDEE